MQYYYDAIVIGSGFGGAVAARRLVQAGKRILILERGREYPPGGFPRALRDTKRVLWRGARHKEYQGLFDFRVLSDMAVVCASGVGGGSLVYANINVIPDADVFEDSRWPEDITHSSLAPYYQKVAQELRVSPLPAELILSKHQRFQAAAQSLGVPVFNPNQAVDWTQCVLCGECEFGCNHSAKNTLDRNYLKAAIEQGAELRTRALVNFIEPTFGGYFVHFTDLADHDKKKQIKAGLVILSAGTLGSNEILFNCRDRYKTLPKISARLGRGFSANGDFMGSIQNCAEPLNPWHGPDVTAVMKISQGSSKFTLAAPTFNESTMRVLASMGQARGRMLRFLGPMLWNKLEQGLCASFERGLFSEPKRLPGVPPSDPERMTLLLAIGRDNANGVLSLGKNGIDIQWDYRHENRALILAMRSTMERIASAYGGHFEPLFTWNMAERITTVHPLGGCALSESADRGVVSPYGQVHGYPGLYVSDGSVVPTALGFHPAMTIAALAERNVEAITKGLE